MKGSTRSKAVSWSASVEIDFSNYQEIVVLTGSGVSVASGIRPFRGKGGIAEDMDVEKFGHVDQLKRDPSRIWELFGPLRQSAIEAEPSQSHHALASLESSVASHGKFTLITQNIDGLHQRAGSKMVLELHGNLLKSRCSNSNCFLQPFYDQLTHLEDIGRCRLCGSVLRPDVVLLGEKIPPSESWKSKRALRTCDLLLVVGASYEVHTIASLAALAHSNQSRILYINIEKIPETSSIFSEQYIGDAEDILPKLVSPV